MRELLSVFLKGFFMGTADTVPGVSGGTIALITGIYERLISAITAIDPSDVRLLAQVHTDGGRAAVRDVLVRIDAPFLAVLGAGIVTAVVTISRVVEVAVETYPGPTAGFFFGLIGASAIVLYREVSSDLTATHVAVAVVGVVLAAAIAGIDNGAGVSTVPIVFVSGAIAICAMVLPGISGAFLLILLGQYDYLRGALISFTDAIVAIPEQGLAPLVEHGIPVVAFSAGALVGLFTIAHAIKWALEHYRTATLAFLVSLMVGGLRQPGEEMLANLAGGGSLDVAIVLLAVVVGTGSVLALDHFTDDLEYA